MQNLPAVPEISVIIPVYNVEKYLGKALESLMYQTFKNIEIICVDDGSTDSSGAVCERFARTDARIKVIHQKNRGTGAARNAGLDAAAGKYISFVDGDDWLHPDFLEVLYRLCEDNGCDIAQCGLALAWSENNIIEATYCEAVIVRGSDMALRNFLPGDGWRQIIVCNKLYRRDLLKNIRFPYGKRHEDEFFTHKPLWNANAVAVTECPLYYYRQHRDSAMGTGFTLEKALDFTEAFEEKTEFYKGKDVLLFYRANRMFAWCLNNYLRELQKYMPERNDIKALLQEKLRKVRASLKTPDQEKLENEDLDKLRLRNLPDAVRLCFDLDDKYNKGSEFISGIRERNNAAAGPKVSVCITVHNGARFLADCLDSVVNQTLADIEIICVEDASTDNSKEILETYAAGDSRIRIIHHENRLGTLVSRRDAVQAAQGKYCMFAGCDGELFPHACDTAYKVILLNQTDVAEFGVKITEPSGNRKDFKYLQPDDADRLEDKNILHLRMQGHLKNWKTWNKIYRTELCRKALCGTDAACSVSAADFLFFCVFGYYAHSASLIKEKLYRWKPDYGTGNGIRSVIGLDRYKELLTEKDGLDAVVTFISARPDQEEYQCFLQEVRNRFLQQAVSRWNENLAENDKAEGLAALIEKWGTGETAGAVQWLLRRLESGRTEKERQLAKLQEDNKELRKKVAELEKIKKSNGYKALKKYYKVKALFL